jgi:hypothetical protein
MYSCQNIGSWRIYRELGEPASDPDSPLVLLY